MRHHYWWNIFVLLLFLVISPFPLDSALASDQSSEGGLPRVLDFPQPIKSLREFQLPKRTVEFKLEVPELVVGNLESSSLASESLLEEEAAGRGATRASYDIPIEVNEEVQRFIGYFRTQKDEFFARSLARSKRYLPMMKEIFRQHEIPEDMVYLALIESGYNIKAQSSAKAVGPWQFIAETGRRYGLVVNRWLDERKDPEKSTIAAARYLRDLYKMFDSWYLALAAYNAGERKILAAIDKFKTTDFWELARFSFLKSETKEFVPKMIAATMMAKEPEKYGFTEVEERQPISYAKVKVPPRTSLKQLAKATGVSYQELRDLNPALSTGVTPPQIPDYQIKVPEEKASFHLEFTRAVPAKENPPTEGTRYTVKKGDTLAKIAKRYGTSVKSLLAANSARGSAKRLRAGEVLMIPGAEAAQRGKESQKAEAQGSYRVRKGDSLSAIASRYGITVKELTSANANNLSRGLRVGTLLIIPAAGQSAGAIQVTKYSVRPGDTLFKLSQKWGVSVQDILAANKEVNLKNLKVGTVLVIPGKEG